MTYGRYGFESGDAAGRMGNTASSFGGNMAVDPLTIAALGSSFVGSGLNALTSLGGGPEAFTPDHYAAMRSSLPASARAPMSRQQRAIWEELGDFYENMLRQGNAGRNIFRGFLPSNQNKLETTLQRAQAYRDKYAAMAGG